MTLTLKEVILENKNGSNWENVFTNTSFRQFFEIFAREKLTAPDSFHKLILLQSDFRQFIIMHHFDKCFDNPHCSSHPFCFNLPPFITEEWHSTFVMQRLKLMAKKPVCGMEHCSWIMCVGYSHAKKYKLEVTTLTHCIPEKESKVISSFFNTQNVNAMAFFFSESTN